LANPGDSFPHLPLPFHVQGAAKLPGGGKPVARTERNKANRVAHAGALRGSLKQILVGHLQHRGERGPDAPAVPTGVPLLLEIEPTNDLDWLISALGVVSSLPGVSAFMSWFTVTGTVENPTGKVLARIIPRTTTRVAPVGISLTDEAATAA
jgi:hypothetical protein